MEIVFVVVPYHYISAFFKKLKEHSKITLLVIRLGKDRIIQYKDNLLSLHHTLVNYFVKNKM